MRNISEIVDSTVDIILERNSCSEEKLLGISTGYPSLDRACGGMKKGELICIAGRPGMGKTALTVNIVSNLIFKSSKNVLAFTIGTNADNFVQQFVSVNTGVVIDNMNCGTVDKYEERNLLKFKEKARNSNLTIVDKPVITVDEISSKCRQAAEEQPLDLVMIDYLQIISGRNKSRRRETDIEEILLCLKETALELNIPIMILSQLSRDMEERPWHRPLLSDFMEECVPNIADTVWFVYRDEYYDKCCTDNVFEIHTAKQYLGRYTTVYLQWRKETCKITEQYRADNRFTHKTRGYSGDDIIAYFIRRLEELTQIGSSTINVEDEYLIAEICHKDMTGVYELGNDDVQQMLTVLNGTPYKAIFIALIITKTV